MVALPDINVLLPIIWNGHSHHEAATAWLDGVDADGEVMLCRASQLGLLRLLNNPVVMGADVQNGNAVWKTWDALLADHRFRFADEPEGFETHLRRLTARLGHQPKRWQDASLAALALAADAELVTFDAGFRSFSRLRCHVLESEAR
ncbi:MAG: TA system VapC family ribonuclease toxin [Chthoniobacteraceae bacterium]|jgi:toxin-antitoxin system PIN domain toxin